MLCEFRRSDDRGYRGSGTGEAEHGDRGSKTRGSGTERRSFIACRSVVRKRWITRLHEAGPQATDSLYHNSDSHPVSGRSQLLLAKQKMATWGVPIRWPTPVGEAKDGDVGCADPMANSCCAKQKMATWRVPIRWPTPVGEARDRDLFYANPTGLDTGTGESEHGDRVRRY